jgi:hypothetical protein
VFKADKRRRRDGVDPRKMVRRNALKRRRIFDADNRTA